MFAQNGGPRTRLQLRVAAVLIAVVLGFVTSLVIPPARPALASSPPGTCTPAEDGDQSLDPNTGLFYECRCHPVSNNNDLYCGWVVIEDDSEEGLANSSFVSAELGYGGGYYAMLRSRASSIGAWEQFSIGSSGVGDGTWAIRSLANRLYVSSEFGYSGGNNGMNRARAGVIGDYEKFYLYNLGGNTYAWQTYLPLGSPCCYVSTELGYGGFEYAMLRSRAYSVGPWEKYSLIYLGGSHVRSVTNTTPTANPGPVVANAERQPCPASVVKATSPQCQQLVPGGDKVSAKKD